jgi:hypothetical protein
MRVMQRTRRSLAAFATLAASTLASLGARAQTPPATVPVAGDAAAEPPPAQAPAPPPAQAPAPPPAQAPAPPPAIAPQAPAPPPASAAPVVAPGPGATAPAAPTPYAPPAPWPGYGPLPPLPSDLEQVRVAGPPPSTRAPADDPQADRGVIAPTAYTHPKGTYYFSDYELALLQFGYAITDDTQITLTGVPPLSEERVLILDVTLKTTLYRGGLVRVAALGSTSGIAAKEIGLVGVGRVGGVVQLCTTRDCVSSLSLSSDVTLAGVLLMINGATGIYRVGRTTSLVAELDTLVPLGKDSGQLNGGLASGGVRFSWSSWGMDLALMRVLGSGGATLPFIAFTYRSAP